MKRSISHPWQWLWNKIRRFGLWFVLIVLIGILVGVLFSPSMEDWVGRRLGIVEKRETVQYLGLAIVGLLLMIQAIISNRRAKAANDTAKAANDTVTVARQSNTLAQFNNAVERLGSESSSVRLGGIYALYHLAIVEKEYRQTVHNILCAHLRNITQEEYEKKQKRKEKPSNEIQNLLDLLCKPEKINYFQGMAANFSDSYLVGADLSDAQLEDANLANAELQNANLSRAQFQNANLFQVKLRKALLNHAQFKNANLAQAQLQGAKLVQAQLQGAYLESAQLQGAYLESAQLQCAYLESAQLQGASLVQAQLQCAYLESAQLQDANLFLAQLQGAILAGAQLQGAKLVQAQLQCAYLESAQLQGASLVQAQLQCAYLESAQLQGASLVQAQLQGSYLATAQLQGASDDSSHRYDPHGNSDYFEGRIRDRVGRDTDLTTVTFSGGIDREQYDSIVTLLQDCIKQNWIHENRATAILDRIKPHVGKPADHDLPLGADAKTGILTKEMADQIVDDYNAGRG